MDQHRAVTTGSEPGRDAPCEASQAGTKLCTELKAPDKRKSKAAVSTKARKPRVVVNVLNTEYDVIKEVLRSTMKFRLIYTAENEESASVGDWDLYWHDILITAEMLSKMRSYQKVNHFPGMECLARKNLLSKNLNRMRKLFPTEYNFFPATWVLPLEWADFKKQFVPGKPRTFIVKPEALSQGKGIYLVRKWEDIDPAEHCVAQRYVNKPFLIDGLKFDLRIYVLVYGCDPYRIFIYREGLARLATEPYKSPNSGNMDNQFVHLTNYAINKDNENFEFNTDENKADVGNKRSLDFVWRYIRERGGDAEQVQREIRRCIIKTLCSVQPLLAHTYRSCQPNDLDNSRCFEILGFDILLDHKMRPWLLEVNHAPSFSTDTPFDHKTKSALLADTFRLLRLRPEKKLRYEKKKAAMQQARLTAGKSQSLKPSKEERAEKKAAKMAKRDEYEANNCGGYVRVYPEPEAQMEYERYIEGAKELWEEFTGGKRRFVPAKAEKTASPPPPAKKPCKNPYAVKPQKPNSARLRAPVASRTPSKTEYRKFVAPVPGCRNLRDPSQQKTCPSASFTAAPPPPLIPSSTVTLSRGEVRFAVDKSRFITGMRTQPKPRQVAADSQESTESSSHTKVHIMSTTATTDGTALGRYFQPHMMSTAGNTGFVYGTRTKTLEEHRRQKGEVPRKPALPVTSAMGSKADLLGKCGAPGRVSGHLSNIIK